MGRLRTTSILLQAFWNFKLKVLKYTKSCSPHNILIPWSLKVTWIPYYTCKAVQTTIWGFFSKVLETSIPKNMVKKEFEMANYSNSWTCYVEELLHIHQVKEFLVHFVLFLPCFLKYDQKIVDNQKVLELFSCLPLWKTTIFCFP